MENIPLGHLSRPQLVNLLLRIVDLLSQPVQPTQPAQHAQACPVLEPYDASIDPWNAPDPTQPVNVTGQGVSCPVTTSGTAYPPGLLNPGASTFYPMVPGACCSYSNGGTCEPSPEPAPGLPRFGCFAQANLAPFTSSCSPVANTNGEGCVTTDTPGTGALCIHVMYLFMWMTTGPSTIDLMVCWNWCSAVESFPSLVSYRK